ncbi:MAG: thioredoxin family protein [Candidatus Kerfeldbacteria bacterium]|nr:thioredoxin family protein [Candidatus Kerfeldbacteria bacterium]
MQRLFISLTIVLVLGIGIAAYVGSRPNPTANTADTDRANVNAPPTTASENRNTTATNAPPINESTGPEQQRAVYTTYSPTALAEAQARGRAVLFFHAAWCPICQALDRELQAGGIERLPEDVTLLKTDFDRETVLKDQYGVTYQYTFVQVDATGAEQAQWSSTDVQSILNHLEPT